MFYILYILLDFNVIYKWTFYVENDCFQKRKLLGASFRL